MTTTPPSGAADLLKELHRVIDDFERRERGIPQAHIAAALVTELRASGAIAAVCKALRAAQQPAPSAAATVGNSGFDYQTAADLLSGKTVSDEAMRKFVTASRWAHDDRNGLLATLLSVRGELASREAEIALLKNALMDAEESRPSTTA